MSAHGKAEGRADTKALRQEALGTDKEMKEKHRMHGAGWQRGVRRVGRHCLCSPQGTGKMLEGLV